jgi:hypothetical protein
MLMVEVLAAGLTGTKWSLDAPAFNQGTRTPGFAYRSCYWQRRFSQKESSSGSPAK